LKDCYWILATSFEGEFARAAALENLLGNAQNRLALAFRPSVQV